MNSTYGYVRVSSRDQNEARQLTAMREFGVPAKNIYVDKQSGKDFEREQYKRLIRRLREDDVLVLKSIDRLGRNYDEILEQWRIITKEKQAAIVLLYMPLLDTRQNRDLTGTLIVDIVYSFCLTWPRRSGSLSGSGRQSESLRRSETE